MPPSKVTYIEDLPELDDIFDKQQSMQGFPPRMNPEFSKQMSDELSERDRTIRPLQGKIRQSSDFRTAIAGGMAGMHGMQGMGMQGMGMQGMGMQGMQRGMPSSMMVPHSHPHHRQENDYEPNDDDEYQLGPRAQQRSHQAQHSPQSANREISCIEIAKHIKSCPICSKFYDTDKSLYIIVIIILLIFCILLLKKILFVKE